MTALAMTDPPQPGTLVVADLVLDLAARRAWRGPRRIRLTPREFGVLALLAARAGEVVTRETLYREVWHADAEPTSNLVDATISHLRAKVDWGHRHRLLHTARGAGYTLSARPEAGGTRPFTAR
jgi:two-component system copper resistance phosphate regulon response regulator CusR